jgi:hypothetical protein
MSVDMEEIGAVVLGAGAAATMMLGIQSYTKAVVFLNAPVTKQEQNCIVNPAHQQPTIPASLRNQKIQPCPSIK